MAETTDLYNPIMSVDGIAVRSPSIYQWSLQDVSSPDAGRTEDALMHKKRISQKVKLQLAWNNIRIEDASAILNAFDPEYIMVSYLDPKVGGYVEKRFYVGDRSAPMYNNTCNVWSNVAFNIIEQ